MVQTPTHNLFGRPVGKSVGKYTIVLWSIWEWSILICVVGESLRIRSHGIHHHLSPPFGEDFLSFSSKHATSANLRNHQWSQSATNYSGNKKYPPPPRKFNIAPEELPKPNRKGVLSSIATIFHGQTVKCPWCNKQNCLLSKASWLGSF